MVSDGGNGFSCDWADWIEPRLVGPAGELKLTELKWKRAESQWGNVRVNQNAGGESLRVHGRPVAFGIGTHANSIIEYDVPDGYDQFRAKGGLDNGGTNQPGDQTSVKFLVYTSPPPAIVTPSGEDANDRTPESATSNLDVHPELEVSLFAAEPMLLSPSNIDIDARGRVWVCEVVNYRSHNNRRPEGDRILILEDTDGDGQADSQKVFYQGVDINSPHGVCVLGNRVIVSAGPHVLCFTDEDGDDQPDKKETWFSGISGVQHDHGIHAFMFGPDGRLYFNFGNEGRQLKDADGRDVIDMAGNIVSDRGQPYRQGMVFRCNPDLSDLETLGWNFRNNWMVTVDSFGTIWQSDNDDDGNRGVRINYVMEFGNYGYRDEMTGAGWQTARTGMADEVPLRHWHLNDPGVVPNLLQTGAGSPTGIMVYEGDGLIPELRSQLIHCDAGPSVTRAYVLSDDGAGYGAEIVNLLQGARDHWFRPSDVKVAPDGSLIVADWYDPGVGGHRMGDLDRGRLFRITRPGEGGKYQVPQYDLTTAEGAVKALQNPNLAVRYVAWTTLHEMGGDAEDALTSLSRHDDPIMRARALWLLGQLPGRAMHYVEVASQDSDPRIRCLAIRLARQQDDVDALEIASQLAHDASPQVRRECVLALRGDQSPRAVKLWVELAQQYDGQDRWYLEALGIGAADKWNTVFDAWLNAMPEAWKSKAGRDIIWRSRATSSASWIAKILEDPSLPEHEVPHMLRALDFQPSAEKSSAAAELAFAAELPPGDRANMIRTEALQRIAPELVKSDATIRQQANQLLDSLVGTPAFIDVIQRFNLQNRYDEVLDTAIQRADQADGIAAARLLLAAEQIRRFNRVLAAKSEEDAIRFVEVLGRTADNRAVEPLRRFMQQEDAARTLRRAAVKSLASIRAGAEWLVEQAEAQQLPNDLIEAVAADLHQVPWNDLRDRGVKLFPLAASQGSKPLPSIRDLARFRGDSQQGKSMFVTKGTCNKCHQVNQEGKQVGPDLSQIGGKLSREAMLESILYPSAGISHNYETFTVELHDGNVLSGLVVSQTDDAVTLKNNEGVTQDVPRDQIDRIVKQPISLMPANLHEAMTEQELVDLVEYLTTLR